MDFGVGAALFGQVAELGFQLSFIAPVVFEGLFAGPVILRNRSRSVVSELHNLRCKFRPHLGAELNDSAVDMHRAWEEDEW